MLIQTSEGTLNVNIRGARVGVDLVTERYEFLVENMSFLSDGDQNDMDRLIALLESENSESFVLHYECLDVNAVNVQGEVMFSVLNRCDESEPEHTVLTASGKQLLINMMRRSKDLNHKI